jgi:hypothetical protein
MQAVPSVSFPARIASHPLISLTHGWRRTLANGNEGRIHPRGRLPTPNR